MTTTFVWNGVAVVTNARGTPYVCGSTGRTAVRLDRTLPGLSHGGRDRQAIDQAQTPDRATSGP